VRARRERGATAPPALLGVELAEADGNLMMPATPAARTKG